jgi:hypothetical protein
MEKKIVMHIWTASSNRIYTAHRQTVRVTAYKLAREKGISNNFNNETGRAGYDC